MTEFENNPVDESALLDEEEDLEVFSYWSMYERLEGIGLFLNFHKLEEIKILRKIASVFRVRV